MANLHIGDYVTFRDRVYRVRGMSPMGVRPHRVQLEDVDTGERIEECSDDVQPKADTDRGDERQATLGGS
jgi:hypothetical protein